MSLFTARLESLVETTRRSTTIEVEGADDIVLYARPVTGRDIENLTRRHPSFADNPTVAAAVDLIIMKAETEAGDKALTAEDKMPLLNLPLTVLTKIREDLFPQETIDDAMIEDEIKN